MIKFYQWLAWKLPHSLIYFAAIRVWAYATTGEFGNTVVSEVSMDTCIRRWKED